MNNKCEFCGAMFFLNENNSLCCENGSITVDLFPEPPDEIKKLLINENN